PEKLEEMLDVSRRLSEGIPFVRVDLYLIRGQVYFGELTFYPTSGFAKFDPESFDRELGGLLTLPGMEDSAPRCGE
ncbi:MAG: hypothetical protein IK116_05220, partial [Firmicutes bacterium]|nr:hypothetical protein [Bacillota bacterium]